MINYEDLKYINAVQKKEIMNAVSEVIDSGWFVRGKKYDIFCSEFSQLINVKNCVGVANGQDALIIALKSLNLPSKSEIIIAENAYVACINAIILSGHIPVLAPVCEKTFNIDTTLLAGLINKNTKAIMALHLYGLTCDMDELIFICNKYNLKLIEDCAQAHLSKYKDKYAGTFGVGCFSFYPTKNLGALGDGGAITTNDDLIYDFCKTYSNYGSKIKYNNEMIGINSRLDELQAAILSVKIKNLQNLISHKNKIAEIYNDLNEFVNVQSFSKKIKFHSYHIYAIKTEHRDDLRDYLLEKNIQTEIHYPIPLQDKLAYKSYLKNPLNLRGEFSKNILSLPINYNTTQDDAIEVCDEIKKYFNHK